MQPDASRAVLERQRAAVVLGDLAAQHEADAGAARLGGEERHEQILDGWRRRVRRPRR